MENQQSVILSTIVDFHFQFSNDCIDSDGNDNYDCDNDDTDTNDNIEFDEDDHHIDDDCDDVDHFAKPAGTV